MERVQRGSRLRLEGAVRWDQPLQIELGVVGGASYDFVCFGLDAQGKLSDDRYMVFYNQLRSPQGEVALLKEDNPALFQVSLNALPPSIERLAFTINIDADTPGTMGQIASQRVSLSQNGAVIWQLDLQGSDFEAERAVIALELYRRQGTWRANFVAQGFNGGLADLLRHYGGEEESEAAAAPPAVPTPVPVPAPALTPASPPTTAPAPAPAAPAQRRSAFQAAPVVTTVCTVSAAGAAPTTPAPADPLANCKVGDTVKLGRYPLEEEGKLEPIEWLVLEVGSGDVLLLSKYGLDACRFNEGGSGHPGWDNCSINNWLNTSFANKAFDAAQRQRIVVSNLSNKAVGAKNLSEDDLPASQGRIFLLSVGEVAQYLAGGRVEALAAANSETLCAPTAYARNRGAIACGGNGNWWLRTSCDKKRSAACINFRGLVGCRAVETSGCTVRPAVRMRLTP